MAVTFTASKRKSGSKFVESRKGTAVRATSSKGGASIGTATHSGNKRAASNLKGICKPSGRSTY